MAETLAENFVGEDRRRVVNAPLRSGPDSEIASLQAMAELGCSDITTFPIATRGTRLVLAGHDFNLSGWGEPLHNPVIDVVETNTDGHIVASIAFDPENIRTAIAELDARYLAGEAAPYAHTWSVIMGAYAAVQRHELPAWTTDAVKIDHRRAIAVAPGELSPYLHAMWNQTPDASIDVVAVHRLTNFGAVIAHVAKGSSQQGFEGEWREVILSTIEGDRISRSEIFDEADLDAALAKFDELIRQASRSVNKASLVEARCQAYISARNWDALATVMADDISIDDRRRVVNAGLRRGREAVVEDLRVGAEIGLTQIVPTPIATRGEHLTLSEIRYSGTEQRLIELVQLVQIDADERITALVLFDPDDLDFAFAELDARYIAGEAAAHARTYSAISGAFAAVNRRELPSITSDLVSMDHRRPIAFAPGELIPYLEATFNDAPELRIDIHEVHRLSSLGAVVTHVWHNTSQQGFDAEWRVIGISTVDGDRINRCELFDETDLDAALARFDELSRPRQALENTASQVSERLWASFTKSDWHTVAEVLAEGIVSHDRRHVVNAGTRRGREVQVADLRAAVDVGAENVTLKLLGTRGDRLALSHLRFSNRRLEFAGDVLAITEIDADERIVAHFSFDVDDLDAAFEELDTRYVAGEAAAYSSVWSVITDTYASLNRHELAATPSDWVYMDHHRLALWQGDFAANMRAAWEVMPDWRIRIVAVHRLNRTGAVLTCVARGTSQEGFDAEMSGIAMVTVRGEVINRFEYFDDVDLDRALARFDELSGRAPRLESAASQVAERYWSCFSDRQWDALTEILADDFSADDRRRIVGAGLRVGREAEVQDLRAIVDLGLTNAASTFIATRGSRLMLGHVRFSRPDHIGDSAQTEILGIIEIDHDQRIKATVVFDPDDREAAFEELDARYLAGEAAPFSCTWSVIAAANTSINRGKLFPTTPDWVNIDHRSGTPFPPSDMTSYVLASLQQTPALNAHIEAVERLNKLGAVVTSVARGATREGFDAEWRTVTVAIVDGELCSRCEMYDEADLDAALARFDELNR